MFDAICQTMLIDIAKSHGLDMQEELQYDGREYLEKQDYILMRQKEKPLSRRKSLQKRRMSSIRNLMSCFKQM